MITDAGAMEDLLAMVAHELRGPLHSIAGWATLLQRGLFEPQHSERAIETILRNVAMQQRLIDDLLDHARIGRGGLVLCTERIDVSRLVARAGDAMLPIARGKNIRLEIQTCDSPSYVLGDAVRLEQVIINLLTNAMNFSRNGSPITVHVKRIERTEQSVEIVVRDSGRGIRREFLPHVFDRFRKSGGHHGLGLGLAIARHIVELHGGSVAAESDGEGQGATFRVMLPCAAVDHETSNGSALAADTVSVEWPRPIGSRRSRSSM